MVETNSADLITARNRAKETKMKVTTNLAKTETTLTYVVRATPPRASRAMSCDDAGAWEATYAVEQMLPAYDGDITIGSVYMVLSLTSDGGFRTLRLADDNGQGWPSNSNYSDKMYRGWRGTNNNTSAHGYGLRRLISCEITGKRAKKLKMVFGLDISK